VDWLLDQLAQALDERDAALAARDGGGSRHADVEDTDPDGVAVTVDEEQGRRDA
jgi:hypothetical protein